MEELHDGREHVNHNDVDQGHAALQDLRSAALKNCGAAGDKAGDECPNNEPDGQVGDENGRRRAANPGEQQAERSDEQGGADEEPRRAEKGLSVADDKVKPS